MGGCGGGAVNDSKMTYQVIGRDGAVGPATRAERGADEIREVISEMSAVPAGLREIVGVLIDFEDEDVEAGL